MIDINTIIQQALEKAITEAVNTRMQDMDASFEAVDRAFRTLSERVKSLENRPFSPGLQEVVNSHVVTYLEDHLHEHTKVPTYEGHTLGDMLASMRNGLNNLSERVGEVQGTLSGMQERFALNDWVNEAFANIRETIGELDDSLQSAHRQINTIDRDSKSSELDSQEVADVIADLFSDGTLTITIDKV